MTTAATEIRRLRARLAEADEEISEAWKAIGGLAAWTPAELSEVITGLKRERDEALIKVSQKDVVIGILADARDERDELREECDALRVELRSAHKALYPFARAAERFQGEHENRWIEPEGPRTDSSHWAGLPPLQVKDLRCAARTWRQL